LEAARPASVGTRLRQDADRAIAERGLAKLRDGGMPSKAEALAIERVERLDIETAAALLESADLPKKLLCRWTGRNVQGLNNQAARFDLPIGNGTWRLPDTLRAYHDAFAKLKRSRVDLDPDEAVLYGPDTPQLERLRAARASMAELELAKAQREVIDRVEAHGCLIKLASRLTGLGETLRQTFGEEARRLLDGAIDDVKREIDGTFADR